MLRCPTQNVPYGRIPIGTDNPEPCWAIGKMSWSRPFHIPIPLPDGRVLRTLRDAGEYIQELPKAKSQRPEWQIAAETLLAAVEGSGPLMFRRDCDAQGSERWKAAS